jgi:uncharacterized protein YjbJ (UPF0337 family)
MHKDTIEGRWKEVRGQLKSRWGRLTADDLARIEGCTEELFGALQRRYGLVRDQAERDGKAFLAAQIPAPEVTPPEAAPGDC